MTRERTHAIWVCNPRASSRTTSLRPSLNARYCVVVVSAKWNCEGADVLASQPRHIRLVLSSSFVETYAFSLLVIRIVEFVQTRLDALSVVFHAFLRRRLFVFGMRVVDSRAKAIDRICIRLDIIFVSMSMW